jgi:hypothetical protein
VDRLVLAPKWGPLNGVDPSCWILKLHDSKFDKVLHKMLQRMLIKSLKICGIKFKKMLHSNARWSLKFFLHFFFAKTLTFSSPIQK